MSSSIIQRIARLWASDNLTLENLLSTVALGVVLRIFQAEIWNDAIADNWLIVYITLFVCSILGFVIVVLSKKQPHKNMSDLKQTVVNLVTVQDLLVRELKGFREVAKIAERRNKDVKLEIQNVRRMMDAIKSEYTPVIEDCPTCEGNNNVGTNKHIDKRQQRKINLKR